MDGLAWRASNRADGEGLWRLLWGAIVACRNTLLDDLDIAVESCGTTLNQGHIRRQAHPVHVPSGLEIVERIEDDIEVFEPSGVELRVFDVRMVRDDLDLGVEGLRSIFGNLSTCQHCDTPETWVLRQETYQSLGLLDVLVSEEELTVEIAQVDGVQVDNVDLAVTGEHEVLEEFASDATSSDHQHARLRSHD